MSISHNRRIPLRDANWLATIYHVLPERALAPSFKRGTDLTFLGRLTEEKGPEAAIRIARAVGMPLRIAAKVPRAGRKYFTETLEPQIDGAQICLAGEVDDTGKQAFLAQASTMLFPIAWPDPFGLALIEAMACGTPITAVRAGGHWRRPQRLRGRQ